MPALAGGSCSGLPQAVELARGAGRRRLGIIPVLFHRPSWLQEMPNNPICCLKTHKGIEKWDSDPGPAGVVAAVRTSGMEKGWESSCEILVYMFGLHQKCFPLLFVAKFPVVDGDIITQGPVVLHD